jgi:VWFA-related protein
MHGKSGTAATVAAAVAAAFLTSGSALRAQNPPPAQPPANPQQGVARSDQVIRSEVALITTDVIVRDNRGQFIADLKKDDFEVYEDGVKQQVISFTLTHGGRTYNVAAPPPPPQMEGIILPPTRPTNDAAGRIFIIFVDDLHLDFRNTGRIRDLFKRISKELIHEGDMFGIVSTGPSSLAIDLTYDRKRLDSAIQKISGAGLAPKEILDQPEGAQGVAEIRYRAHVAFSTAYDLMQKLEQVHNRRKAFIYEALRRARRSPRVREGAIGDRARRRHDDRSSLLRARMEMVPSRRSVGRRHPLHRRARRPGAGGDGDRSIR